jgi:hypothetical protein
MDVDRRQLLLYASLAVLAGAAWVWAAGQYGGPAAADRMAWGLGTLAALGAILGALWVLRSAGGQTRPTALVLAVVCLALLSGVVAAAHLTGAGPISGDATFGSGGGLTVTVDGSTDAYLAGDDISPLNGVFNVVTEDGNITFSTFGDAHAEVAVGEITGTWTNVTNIDADPNDLTIGPADKSSVTVAQEVDQFNYTGTFTVDDGTVDFVYSGTGGVSEVSITGVVPDQQIIAVDADTGNFLDVATSDSNGDINFDALTNSKHAVLLQTRSLQDPILENPTPTGDLSSDPSQVEVDVKDPEFDNGDTVTVTISIDGSDVKTTSISANQTVSASVPASGKTGGVHDWSVEADPKYGDTVTESYQFTVPSTLYVRNASNHSQLIKSPLSVDGTFFSEDSIIDRQGITGGTIDMSGLPVSDSWIVRVEPSSDNYTTRTLWVNNIYEQQSIYLLNKSAFQTVDSRFVLSDPGAEYDAQSILKIQKPINTSTQTEWQTVHSDAFGAEGVTAELEQGQRYRLKVRNEDGDEQIVGPYRADVSETVTVEPGAPVIEIEEFNEGWGSNAELRNDTLEYIYNDTQDETDKLTVWIHERGNVSNRLVANATYFNLGEASAQHTLTVDEKSKVWDVVFIIERNGETKTQRETVSNRATGLFGSIPENWRLMIGLGSLFLFAGVFSLLNAAVGAVVVSLVGGLWWFVGLLPGATTGIAFVLALLLSVLAWMRAAGGP